MPDIAGWAGMSFFAALLGAFLGYALSYGSFVATGIGALVLIVLSTIYAFTIGT